MARTLLGDRAGLDPRSLGIVVGDLLLIAVVIGLGELRHSGSIGDFLITAAEFGLAWLLVGTLSGAIARDAIVTPRRAATIAVASWAAAAVLGAALRAAVEPAARFDPTFVFVMFAVGAILLVPWRTGLAVRRGASSDSSG